MDGWMGPSGKDWEGSSANQYITGFQQYIMICFFSEMNIQDLVFTPKGPAFKYANSKFAFWQASIWPSPPFPSDALCWVSDAWQLIVKHTIKHLSSDTKLGRCLMGCLTISCQASVTQHKASVKRLTETVVYKVKGQKGWPLTFNPYRSNRGLPKCNFGICIFKCRSLSICYSICYLWQSDRKLIYENVHRAFPALCLHLYPCLTLS